MSTYGSLQGSFSSFSDDEKLNYALKIALSRLQTDLAADWFNEPTDFIPKQPLELYKNVISSYASIQNFLLIDPDVDGNGKEMVTDKTVGDILSVAGNGSQFTLSDILDTTKVRDPSQFSNLPNSAFVDGASKTQIKLLGRNMFTRYKYWTSGLTGKNSLLKGNAVDGGGGSNTGTTPDEKEPFNAYITYTDTGSLSPERKWDVINGAAENSDHKQFYNKLISEGVELNIIDPNLKSDLTKKHPFLKLCLQVLTYTTRGSAPISENDNNSSSGSVNKTDNIGFHNPLMEKALGDTNGFLSGAGYQIAGWNGSSWKSVTTSYGTAGYQNILYFLSNPGFILVYGQKNIDYGYFTSRSHPPMISFLRYTGETFSDGIISQGDTLPAVEVSNDKDLFINTDDNTIHRLEDNNGTKTWVGIGGGGGGIISQGDTLPAVEVSNDKDLFINTADNTIHRLEDNNGTKTWVGIGGGGGDGDMEINGNLTVSGGNTNIGNTLIEGTLTTNGLVGIGTDPGGPTSLFALSAAGAQGGYFSSNNASNYILYCKGEGLTPVYTVTQYLSKFSTNCIFDGRIKIGKYASSDREDYIGYGQDARKVFGVLDIEGFAAHFINGDISFNVDCYLRASYSNSKYLDWGVNTTFGFMKSIGNKLQLGGNDQYQLTLSAGGATITGNLTVNGTVSANGETLTGGGGGGEYLLIDGHKLASQGNATLSYKTLNQDLIGTYGLRLDSGGSTYINAYSNKHIYFLNDNLLIGVFSSSGKFGIGNISPSTMSSELEVHGSAYVQNNVGIGTTTPAYKLHVHNGGIMVTGWSSTDEVDGVRIYSDYAIGNTSGWFETGVGSTSSARSGYDGVNWCVQTKNGNTSWVNRFRINSTGNIYLDTGTTITGNLTVTGTVSANGETLTNGGGEYLLIDGHKWARHGYATLSYKTLNQESSGTYGLLLDNEGSTYINAYSNKHIYFLHNDIQIGVFSSSGKFGIGNISTSTMSSELEVHGSAYVKNNVGIGTTTPADKLHVYNGGIWVTGAYGTGDVEGVRIYSEYLNDHTSGWFETRENGNGKYGARSGYDAVSNHWCVQTRNNDINWVNRFRIRRENGYVGIGTPTTPSAPLHVNHTTGEPIAIFESSHDCSVKIKGPGGEVYLEIANTSTTSGNTSKSWGVGTNDDDKLHIAWGNNGTMNKSDAMVITSTRYVGIGTVSPAAPLHVYGNPFAANGIYIRSYLRPGTDSYSAGGGFSGWDSSDEIYGVSIFAEYSIFSKYGYVGASDERIKENIIEVDDNSALKKVRDISCCWYNYKDKVEKGEDKVLGFIAQQVKEHLPEAVGRIKSIIPDKMKKIHTSWNETKMTSNDLQDVSGIKYRFYVSNDISGNEEMVELVGDENNSFTFKEKWENVFCYGKEVDDFHTLDKQKLFALNFSATQEIDRIQQQQLLDISGNAIAVKGNKNEIELLKLANEELTNRVSTLENEINSLKIIVGSLVNNN